MKKPTIWRLALMNVIAAMTFGVVACGNEEDVPVAPPAQEDAGEVTFSVDVTDGGTGAGTYNSPATVEQGDTLNMTISQKSTYKDTDGSIHTFEPKATIALHTSADTLYTKDLKELTTVSEPNLKTTSTGTDPVTHSTVQTFSIGGKDVTFDLAYEIFNYVNSKGVKKEMPYVKLNNAQYGKASSSEVSTRAGQKAIASVSGMSIRPHNATRGIVVTENTAYDVNVKFNLDVESVNTSSTQKQNLAFEVNFLAIVESSRELPDLVDVKYRKDFIIEEPHHNFPLATRYVVYRDKIYSNGETVTDTFTSGLCAAMEGDYTINDKLPIILYHDIFDNIATDTVAVTNPEATEFVAINSNDSTDFQFGEKLETYELMGAGEYFNPESPKEGWYFRDVSKIYQRGAKNPEIYHRNLRSAMAFYDRFLYIDGQIIDFWDMVMTHNVEYTSESKTLEDGRPAKVFTLKHTAKYLGMDFSITLHDVYVQKK